MSRYVNAHSGEGRSFVSKLMRSIRALGAIISVLTAVTVVYQFWDVICERHPGLAQSVPFATCPAPRNDTALLRSVAESVEGIRTEGDPKVVAMREIESRGYTIDNAGLIGAIADQSNAQYFFDRLSIRGDDASFRKALLSHRIGTTQFASLHSFAQLSGSGTYARVIAEELEEYAKDVTASGTLAGFRSATCGGDKPASFAAELAQRNLGGKCEDELAWYETSLHYLKGFRVPVDELQYVPTTAKPVAQPELLAISGRYMEALEPGFLVARRSQFIRHGETSAVLGVHNYSVVTLRLPHDVRARIGKACDAANQSLDTRDARCRADFYAVVASDRTVKVIGIDNVEWR